MSGDFSVTNGDIRLRVKGLTRTVRALEAAGTASGEMRDLMHEIGMIVVRDARSRVPTDSGALRKTIRAGRGKTKAVVRAGTPRTLYAPVIHYGNRAQSIDSQPFVVDALRAQRSAIFARLDDGIAQLLTTAGL